MALRIRDAVAHRAAVKPLRIRRGARLGLLRGDNQDSLRARSSSSSSGSGR